MIEGKYPLGKFGELDLIKFEDKTINGTLPKEEGFYVFEGKNKEKFEQNMAFTLEQEKIKYQNKANELEELALRIEENGLEKTSQYYQTLQSKNKEGGN
jgi:hypothetical protein